jgi:hypothetical protein
MGTLKWKWSDDEGKKHKFLIPKSHCVPDGKVRLLSPQRWGQAMKKGNTPVQGTGSKTVHDKVTLFWNQRKNKLSVPLGTSSCATFQLAPGHAKFNAFCAEADVDYNDKQRHPITADALQVASNKQR